MANFPEFTIAIICHGDPALVRRTLPISLKSLCQGTRRSYDLMMMIDGAETAPTGELVEIAKENGIDEIRFRYRHRNCAGGDPSNNGHLHLVNDKTPYLLTFEGDIVCFRLNHEFDVLDAVISFFESQVECAVIHKVDDHDEWCWKLEKAADDFGPGILSVNRVASHFLAYNVSRFRRSLGQIDLEEYYDKPNDWYNYEDKISQKFAAPFGTGIAFPVGWPIRVFHCDRKITLGSVYYSRSLEVKLSRLDERECEMARLGWDK